MTIELSQPLEYILKTAADKVLETGMGYLPNVFVYTPEKLITYSENLSDKFNKEAIKTIKEKSLKYIKSYFNDNEEAAAVATSSIVLKDNRYYEFVAVRSNNEKSYNFTLQPEAGKRRALHSLYHELGHNFLSGTHHGEREDIAETFATLMYVRDFPDADIFEYKPYSNAYNALDLDYDDYPGAYYHTNIMLASERLSKQIDLTKLSIEEVAEASKEIVKRYSPSEEVRQKIYFEFKYFGSADGDISINDNLECMLETDNHDVFRTGNAILQETLIAKKNDAQFLKRYSSKIKEVNKKAYDRGVVLNPIDAIDAKTGVDGITEIVSMFKVDNPKSVIAPLTL